MLAVRRGCRRRGGGRRGRCSRPGCRRGPAWPRSSAFIVSSMRRTSGCSMIERRLARRRAGGPALLALLGVLHGVLVGPLGQREALEADRQAGVVHHREHVPHALVLLADQVADGAVAVAVGHDAGGAGLDAHLVLDRRRTWTSLRSPSVPSSFTRNLGTMKHEMPLVPGGASGVRASTRWTMFSVMSCSPKVMKIFVPGDAVGAVVLLARPWCAPRRRRSRPAGSVRFIVPVHSPVTILGR